MVARKTRSGVKNVPDEKKATKKVSPDNRMSPEDIETGLTELSNNVVSNVEYVLEQTGMTWRSISIAMGLGTSTVYQVKNGKAKAGITTAVQWSRALGVEAWMLFMPPEKFTIAYKARFNS